MNFFDRAASHIARLMGQPAIFALACSIILVWGAVRPVAGYSDTWQLVINTSTTIVTFLMVFLIQNTQNRDNHAIHLKLDELLRALDAADTRLVDLEERSKQELNRLHKHYLGLASGETTGAPDAQLLATHPPGAPTANRLTSESRNQSLRQGVQPGAFSQT